MNDFKSDTTRTDAILKVLYGEDPAFLTCGNLIDLCRNLEREVAVLREALEKISNTNYHRGPGPHCTCSQEDREEITRAALKGKP